MCLVLAGQANGPTPQIRTCTRHSRKVTQGDTETAINSAMLIDVDGEADNTPDRQTRADHHVHAGDQTGGKRLELRLSCQAGFEVGKVHLGRDFAAFKYDYSF